MLKILLLAVCLQGINYSEKGDYDLALPLLNFSEKAYVPLQYWHKFYFYKTVAEFQTLNKKDATVSSKKFFDAFEQPPRRYEQLILGMQYDMERWGKDPLDDIARKMGNVSRRLDLSKGGLITQKKQKEIVDDLDRLIKDAEDAKNKAEADAQAKANQGNKQTPGQAQQQPAPDSIIMGGKGEGKIDEQKLRQIAQTWGSLPPAKRAQVVQDLTRELPPKFEPLIKRYFEALDKLQK